jgi:hypothetical protein
MMSNKHSWDQGNFPRRRYIRVVIDGKVILIPVRDEDYAHFQEQFVRRNPTPQQYQRYITLMNIIIAAFKEGLKRPPQQ